MKFPTLPATMGIAEAGLYLAAEQLESAVIVDPKGRPLGVLDAAQLDRMQSTNGGSDAHTTLAEGLSGQHTGASANQHRLNMQSMLSEISRRFNRLEPEDLEPTLEWALMAIGGLAQAERVYLALFDAAGSCVSQSYWWVDVGINADQERLQALALDCLGDFLTTLQHDGVVRISKVGEMPAQKAGLRDFLLAAGIQSLLCVPISWGGQLRGFISYDSTQEEAPWSREDSSLLRTVGELFAAVLKRQQDQNRLKASEAALKEAQGLAHLGSWSLDLQTKQLDWSDEVFRIFEIESTGSIPTYQGFLARVHPDDRERVDQCYTDSVERHQDYSIEHRLSLADGRIKYVHERGISFYGEDGAPIRSIGTVQDITQLREAELRIRRRNEFELALREVSARCNKASVETLDLTIDWVLERIGKVAGADRSYLFQLHDDRKNMVNSHEWCAAGIEPVIAELQSLAVSDFQWFIGKLQSEHQVHIPVVAALPDELDYLRTILEGQGVQSLLDLPVSWDGVMYGFVGFDAVRRTAAWTSEDLELLHIFADMLAATLRRVSTERALIDSEMRFRRFASAIGDVIWILNVETGKVEYVNQAYEVVWQRAPQQLLMDSDHWLQDIHPDDRARVEASWINGSHAAPWEEHYRILRPDGEVRWIRDRSTPFFDADKKLTHIVGIAEDITEGKQILDQRDRFFELSIDLLCVATLDGRFVEVSPSFERTFGYSREAVLSVPFIDFVHPEDREATAWVMGKLSAGEVVKGFENRYRDQAGNYHWLQWHASPDLEAGLGYAVARDVTAERKALEATREREAMLEGWLKSAKDFVVLRLRVVPDKPLYAEVELVSPSIAEVLGLHPGDPFASWIEVIHPDDRVRVVAAHALAMETGTRFDQKMRIYHGVTGALRWIHVISEPTTDNSGRVTHFNGLIYDISEQRQAQDAIEQAAQAWIEAMDQIDDATYLLDQGKGLVRANQAFYKLTQTTANTATGCHIVTLLHPYGEALPCEICQAQDEKRDAVITLERDDGSNPTGVPIEVRIKQIQSKTGADNGMLVSIHDLTQSRQTRDALELASAVFGNSPNGILVTDVHGVIQQINNTYAEITGYTASEVVGKTSAVVKSGRHSESFYRNIWHALNTTGSWQGEISNRRKSGEVFGVWQSIDAVRDPAGNIIHFVGTFHDLSRPHSNTQAIYDIAHHDALTGLASGLLFMQRSLHVIERARRATHQAAFLYLDLNHLSEVNARFGYGVGDALLQAVSERLRAALRNEDSLARYCDDEFVLAPEQVVSAGDAEYVAKKILKTFEQAFSIEGREIVMGAYIGISLFPNDATEGSGLVANARRAMQQAKSQGSKHYAFYADE